MIIFLEKSDYCIKCQLLGSIKKRIKNWLLCFFYVQVIIDFDKNGFGDWNRLKRGWKDNKRKQYFKELCYKKEQINGC